MSCLGPDYDPNPPKEWYRVQSQCTYNDPNFNLGVNTAYIPALKKNVPLQDLAYELSVINKGNVLQYKANSANITKSQKYSLIAKGAWNRKKAWATQTQSYSNPNVNSFQRVNYPGLINIVPNTSQEEAEICQNNSIPDGGNLNARLIVNQCTGQVIKRLSNNICFPTSASDVPGKIINLCYNDNMQTWYPRQRYFMPNAGNKFPEGYKGFVSANTIPSANKI
jgi:hypothetical protein